VFWRNELLEMSGAEWSAPGLNQTPRGYVTAIDGAYPACAIATKNEKQL
jgi:hypothetical protein